MRNVFGCLLMSVLFSSPLLAQAEKKADGKRPPVVPTISARTFTAGSATVSVTGSFQIQAEIPLNTKASIGDPEMTYLQYGASGAPEPNVLITFQPLLGEVGIGVGRGKLTATGGVMEGGESDCAGKTDVTANLVSGSYTCPEVTSYDPATGKMGKVKIVIRFNAKS